MAGVEACVYTSMGLCVYVAIFVLKGKPYLLYK